MICLGEVDRIRSKCKRDQVLVTFIIRIGLREVYKLSMRRSGSYNFHYSSRQAPSRIGSSLRIVSKGKSKRKGLPLSRKLEAKLHFI